MVSSTQRLMIAHFPVTLATQAETLAATGGVEAAEGGIKAASND
jgi:hypothetical protein